MNSVYKAVKISKNVYWVGAIDWNIRDFHGYTTRRGTTYNAYLVLSDKITLIDTVREPFRDEMLSRIASIINPQDIRFIVSNHSEMDHTGCLAAVMDIVKPDEVYASVVGAETLREMYSIDGVIPIKDGGTLDLGTMTLSFMETRMLHWPDSMFSFVNEEKVLFSHDAFGMHLASSERFADEIDQSILDYEGATYFANILLPYAQLVLKLIEKVDKLGYEFEVVAPDHGPVWRESFDRVLKLYSTWALQQPLKKAVVVYATMWHSTELMARAISEGLARSGVDVKLMSMAENHRSDVAYEVLDAGALIVGSPTLNNNVFPSIADVLTYLKGLRPRNLIGAAFGSYGWSGESIRQIEDILKEMKVDLVSDAVSTKHVPDFHVIDQCFSLGKMIGEQLDKRVTTT
ncbi:MAG: FprA family A-type flavoprotein [Deltaproteobacteria bacterium]|nr:FprA family A-type flavoprotein [Deltaproteobacteria bacterium]